MSAHQFLPEPVAAMLAAAFPGQPLARPAPTVGGFSNFSLQLRIGGRPCVVKAADREAKRADLRREARLLTLLAGRRLRAPALLAALEDAGWTALVLARRPGAPGIGLYGGPPEALLPPLRALGHTLARVHAAPLVPPPDAAAAGLLLADRAAALRAALAALPLPDDLRGPLDSALAHPAWRTPRPRLLHGDAGLHNVLWGAAGLTLLDWELAGWGDPRLDLAWAAWTLRFRAAPAGALQALLDGYGRERATALAPEPSILHALALGQIAGLAARAAGGPGWDEWQRRARWTIAGGPSLLSLPR